MPIEPLSAKTTAIGILSAQTLLGLATAAIFWFFLSFESAKSSIAGSMVAVFFVGSFAQACFYEQPPKPKKDRKHTVYYGGLKISCYGSIIWCRGYLVKSHVFPINNRLYCCRFCLLVVLIGGIKKQIQ